jgi:hypothetical protein
MGGTPNYKLIKSFPGIRVPVGTIFCLYEHMGGCHITESGIFNMYWINDYFEPWIGEFFEKITPT